MSNGTYQKTTSASRRAARAVKYKFVSKRVSRQVDQLTGVRTAVVEDKGRTYVKPIGLL
jgi:hypothetical protein